MSEQTPTARESFRVLYLLVMVLPSSSPHRNILPTMEMTFIRRALLLISRSNCRMITLTRISRARMTASTRRALKCLRKSLVSRNGLAYSFMCGQ